MTSRALLTAIAAGAATLLVLGGCAADSPEQQANPPASDAFPVTIEHAFGETEISSEPQRVLTLGWGSAEAALALGVVPVAMEAQSYGGDDRGILPWVAEELADLGAADPVIFPQSSEIPAYEQIAAAAPDLILAVYSGITEEQFEVLNDIAPTVAYPDEAWSTPWKDVVRIVGTALGQSAGADAVLADVDDVLAQQKEAHPELQGKTVAAIWDMSGTFYVYRAEDPRVNFLFDLGLENAPAVDELATGESTFFYTLSYEELDKLDSDILVNFANTEDEAQGFLTKGYAKAIPAVADGAVASITGTELIAAVSPPTALSLTWGIDRYVEQLAEAAESVG